MAPDTKTCPFDATWIQYPFGRSFKVLVKLFKGFPVWRSKLCNLIGDEKPTTIVLLSSMKSGIIRPVSGGTVAVQRSLGSANGVASVADPGVWAAGREYARPLNSVPIRQKTSILTANDLPRVRGGAVTVLCREVGCFMTESPVKI